MQYSHCGCPIPGDSIGQKLSRLIGAQSTPPSHLLPFNRPDLLSATHPSDHNAVHFQSRNEHTHKVAAAMYTNLGRQKKRRAQKAAKKALKQAAKSQANGTRQRAVSLPALLPPHAPRFQNAPRLQTSGTVSTSRLPLWTYATPFLIPVPIILGSSLVTSCMALDGNVIGPSGSCGSGGLNALGGGCGGTGGGVACGAAGTPCGGEPEFLFIIYWY